MRGVDWGPLDEGPKPRRSKVRCLLHDIILEGNTNDLNQRNELGLREPFWEGRVQRGSGSRVQIGPCVLGPWMPLRATSQ